MTEIEMDEIDITREKAKEFPATNSLNVPTTAIPNSGCKISKAEKRKKLAKRT